MENYDTVVAALQGLKSKGYTLDFNIAFDKITCNENGVCLNPDEFEITEVYRFEGATNPDDQDVVYAVESKDGSIKGSLTSAYGPYADSISNDMVQKLSMHTNS
ncbi:MAG: phosphoribosylpyrophosphate synthetase [Ferruginibacter sp.]